MLLVVGNMGQWFTSSEELRPGIFVVINLIFFQVTSLSCESLLKPSTAMCVNTVSSSNNLDCEGHPLALIIYVTELSISLRNSYQASVKMKCTV